MEDWGNHNKSLPIIAILSTFEQSFSKFNLMKIFQRSNYDWWKTNKPGNDIYWKWNCRN